MCISIYIDTYTCVYMSIHIESTLSIYHKVIYGRGAKLTEEWLPVWLTTCCDKFQFFYVVSKYPPL